MSIEKYFNTTRYFPYYKGEYIGKDRFGFSSIDAAIKYIKISFDDNIIYNEIYGSFKNYVRHNSYFYKLSNKKYYNTYYTKNNSYKTIYSPGKEIIKSQDFTDEEYNELVNEINKVDLYTLYIDETINNIINFQTKYKLFPVQRIDMNPFYKDRMQYINDNIEIREGVITDIIIEWKNKS